MILDPRAAIKRRRRCGRRGPKTSAGGSFSNCYRPARAWSSSECGGRMRGVRSSVVIVAVVLLIVCGLRFGALAAAPAASVQRPAPAPATTTAAAAADADRSTPKDAAVSLFKAISAGDRD